MKNIPQSMSCTFYIRLHIDESERKARWRSYTFSSLWKCFIHKHSFTTLCRSCSSTPSTLPSPIPSFSSVLPRFVSLHRWYTFKFPKGWYGTTLIFFHNFLHIIQTLLHLNRTTQSFCLSHFSKVKMIFMNDFTTLAATIIIVAHTKKKYMCTVHDLIVLYFALYAFGFNGKQRKKVNKIQTVHSDRVPSTVCATQTDYLRCGDAPGKCFCYISQ